MVALGKETASDELKVEMRVEGASRTDVQFGQLRLSVAPLLRLGRTCLRAVRP